LDATESKSKKFDLLYFDCDGDRDLTDETQLGLAEELPSDAPPNPLSRGPTQYFETVELPGGGGEGDQSLRFVPWLNQRNARRPYLILAGTVIHKANIHLGQQDYEVILPSHIRPQRGRAWLRPAGGEKQAAWSSVTLGRLQRLDDAYVTLSVEGDGKQLRVAPYRGKLGQIRLDPNQDLPQNAGFTARLYRSDRASFMLGDYYGAEFPRQYRVPTGDYRGYFYVDYGKLRVSLSQSATTVEIREDQPFELKLGGKPEVVFTSPKKQSVFRPGSKVRFKAMLKDTANGTLIRGLYDTTKVARQRTILSRDGTSRSIPVYESLTPTVSITDDTGKEVASGRMPFG
jgi:hypothetical protein